MKRKASMIMAVAIATTSIAPNIACASIVVPVDIAKEGSLEALYIVSENKIEITGTGTLSKEKFTAFFDTLPEKDWDKVEHSLVIKDALKLPMDCLGLFSGTTEDKKGEFLRNATMDFNPNIDTSKVVDMKGMFEGLQKADPDVSNWDVSKVEFTYRLFRNTEVANPDLSNWKLDKISNMDLMFSNAQGVTRLFIPKNNLTGIVIFYNNDNEADITATKAFLVGNKSSITFKEGTYAIYKDGYMVPESKFTGNNLENAKLETLSDGVYRIAKFGEDKSVDIAEDGIVRAEFLEEDKKILITGTGTLSKDKFEAYLNSLPEGGWRVDQFVIQDALTLPEDCSKLFSGRAMSKHNYLTDATMQFNPNINTSGVKNMSHMFMNARKANPDVSNWDVGNVTDMNHMFGNAQLATPDVSNWDVSKVQNMNEMFSTTQKATPDLSKWKLSSILNMRSMFRDAHGVTSLVVPENNLTGVKDFYRVYENEADITATKAFFLGNKDSFGFKEGTYAIYKDGHMVPESKFTGSSLENAKLDTLSDGVYRIAKFVEAPVSNVFDISVAQDGSVLANFMEEEDTVLITGDNDVSEERYSAFFDTLPDVNLQIIAKGSLFKGNKDAFKLKSSRYAFYNEEDKQIDGTAFEGDKITLSEEDMNNLPDKIVYLKNRRYKISPEDIGSFELEEGNDANLEIVEKALSNLPEGTDILINGTVDNGDYTGSVSVTLVYPNNESEVIDIPFTVKKHKKGGGYSSSGSRSSSTEVEFIVGSDRYETSLKAAKKVNSSVLVVASGDNFADALSSSALNRYKNLGLILIDGSKDVKLDKQVVYTYGGEDSVKTTYGKRLSGKDRYATNTLINKELGSTDTAILVDGSTYPDALSAQNLLSYKASIVLGNSNTDTKVLKLKKKLIILGGRLKSKIHPNG